MNTGHMEVIFRSMGVKKADLRAVEPSTGMEAEYQSHSFDFGFRSLSRPAPDESGWRKCGNQRPAEKLHLSLWVRNRKPTF